MNKKGKWYDIDEFFEIYDQQEQKNKPMPKNTCLSRGKRKELPSDKK